jgi:zinc protease
VLELRPFPAYAASGSDVDRTRLPVPAVKPEVRFPTLQRTTLSNGLTVVLAERAGVPVVQFGLLVDAGFAADPGDAPGTARLAMDMLTEGTRRHTSLELSDALALLGADLGAGCSLDTCSVSLTPFGKISMPRSNSMPTWC